MQEQLLTAYSADTPAAILYRVSWPDEKIVLTELGHLAEEVRRHKLSRTTLIVVGEAVARRQNRSRLYDRKHGTSSGGAAVTKRVLLLSGTSEGPPLARALLAAGFAVRATVTRAEACDEPVRRR